MDTVLGVLTLYDSADKLPNGKSSDYITLGRWNGNKCPGFVQGWTTMKVVGEALRRAGGQTDGESLKAALETLRHFDTGGVCDTITFTPQSRKGARKLRIYQVKQGKWQPITPFIEATR